MIQQFQRLQSIYDFTIIDGERPPDEINAELRREIQHMLQGAEPPHPHG